MNIFALVVYRRVILAPRVTRIWVTFPLPRLFLPLLFLPSPPPPPPPLRRRKLIACVLYVFRSLVLRLLFIFQHSQHQKSMTFPHLLPPPHYSASASAKRASVMFSRLADWDETDEETWEHRVRGIFSFSCVSPPPCSQCQCWRTLVAEYCFLGGGV